MRKILGYLVVTCIAGGGAWAGAEGRWIHVRVDEADGRKGRVDLQVPLGPVSTLRPALQARHGGGYLCLTVDDRGDGSRVRSRVPLALVALGEALQRVPAGELLTVDDKESHVRIWIDAKPAAPRGDGR